MVKDNSFGHTNKDEIVSLIKLKKEMISLQKRKEKEKKRTKKILKIKN